MNKLVGRVKSILMTPRAEWPVIASEPATVADLYKNYIVLLAAIPAVAGFIKGSLIGYSGFGVHVRTPVATGLTTAIVTYLLTLGLVYVVALIVDALAPTFGGEKNPVQALKAVAYSYTASWIASIALILPVIGVLVVIAGGIYGIYLLYLGLPVTMKAPRDKAVGYTAVTIILAIVLGWVVGLVVAGMAGTAAITQASLGGGNSGIVTIDDDSALGKLDAWSKKMEAAGAKLESAQKSGDADAQAAALGAVMGTALGGGAQVEALAPDLLKPFVPETLGGLARTEISAERNGALGMQVSEARATYSDGAQRQLHLEVIDMGSAKGLMGLAGLAGVESERQTEHGYEKTYKQDGRLVQEQWDTQSRHGEFSIVLGNRFNVKVSGDADNLEQIKAAAASLDLAGLEAMKDHGVKQG
jgi:hypothetical protein